MNQHFDAIIIGSGQAGPALADRLTKAGRKTALIERAEYFGGTCVNNGCIPTKTMLASARAAYVARRAAEFGVVIDGAVSVDMRAVKARKDRIVEASRSGLAGWLKQMPGLTLYQGHARFIESHRVQVGDDTLTADQIFINVGGRPVVPDLPGLAAVKFFTNLEMMAIDFLPAHLVIVGGSYVGLEFAQMYRRFGSRVTVIEMGPRLIGREDEDVSIEIKAILEREGIEVELDSKCIAVSRQGDDIAVSADCKTRGGRKFTGSHLLLAVGRKPNTEDLGLAEAGIAMDDRGYIQVDEALQTSVSGVFALGDVNGRGAFTHTAYNDFEIVAANLIDHQPRRVSDRIPAYALYTDPPLGRVGQTEAQVRKSGRPALTAKLLMSRVGRAYERGETQGFMKVLVDAETQQILGASLLGIECDEVVHTFLDLMAARAPYTVVKNAMHIHPTVSEMLPTLFSELAPL